MEDRRGVTREASPVINIWIGRPYTNTWFPVSAASYFEEIRKRAYASRWGHRAAAYPHSRQDDALRSDHSKSIATKFLSRDCQRSRMALGSPSRTRTRSEASAVAGSVLYNFL